jgi:hypothetical protein
LLTFELDDGKRSVSQIAAFSLRRGSLFLQIRRIGGSQIQSGSFGDELNLLSLPEKKFSFT